MPKAQEINTIATNLELTIRNEIGAESPIPYEVEPGPAKPTSAKSFLLDAWRGWQDKPKGVLCTVRFDLTRPGERMAELEVTVNKRLFTTFVTALQYEALLSVKLDDVVALETGGFFANAKFEGEEEASAKLNAVKDLPGIAWRFMNEEYTRGNAKVRINGLFGILTGGERSVLHVRCLPDVGLFGGKYKFGIKEFFEVADLIDETLQ